MRKRLLLISLLIFCFRNSASAICLPGWSYNRPITVTNSNASAYTNFQVKLIVNTQALISAGKMNINGNDIRFTDANCNNLHYWIDSGMNTTTTVIWVKVNTLAASTTKTIYMYYGNFCATPAQNGDSTFVLFDDFNGSSINTAKWNINQETPGFCSISVASGAATLSTTNYSDNDLVSVNSFAGPLRIEAKVIANSGSAPSIALLNSAAFTGVTLFTADFAFNDEFHLSTTGGSCASYIANANSSSVARNNGIWGLAWAATNSANAVFPGGTQSIVSTPAMAANQRAGLGLLCTSLGSISYDWTRVRRYAPTEMGTALNTEANQGITISLSPLNICPGALLTIVFSKNGIYFNSGNTFKAELSDASGSFASPITLGTYNDTVPDTIFGELPKLLPAGTGYKVRLSTTDPVFSCFVAPASLTVYPKPNVSYTFPNDSQCYKWSRYDFTATASVSGGTITSYIWNWDDGNKLDTVTTNTISHKFKFFYPYYYPKLTVVSNLGCKDSVSERVNILESPVVRTEFNDTIQCLRGNLFIIQTRTSTFNGIGTIVSNSWDVGDGSPVLNNIDSFSHQYALSGIYNIRQINQHSNGCIDTGVLSGLVNLHPVAKINTNDTDQCIVGNAFVFEAQSTITNGLPLLNSWDIDDGITKEQQDSVHHIYSPFGNRTIQLITTSDDGLDGCADTVYQEILVNPMPKAIVNNLDVDKCLNYNSFRFIGKSTISTGTVSHNWDFGDLSTINNQDTVTHSYASSGTFTIKLRTVSGKGCIDSTTTSVNVRPSPVPSFTLNKDTQCFKYHLFKGTSTSTITSGTFSKTWLINDGNDYTNVDTMYHQFATDGKYEIQLILKSNFNCSDTISDSVVVLPMPVSSFLIDKADQCFEGNNFTYTDNSFFNDGAITGIKWLYGDGNTLDNVTPTSHVYSAEGPYAVALIAYGDNGCFDSSFQNVAVYPHPASDFLINDTGQCVNNNSFRFTNNTFITEGSFTNRWFFGDGSNYIDALEILSKKYTKDSTYKVTVISFSDQGCTDTASHTVTVFPKSKTNFTIDNPLQCRLGNSFNFTSTTTLKKGTFSIGWQFGDGSIGGNQTTIQHAYIGVQTYNVRLISTTDEGCLDTMTKTVRTLAMPVANFNFNYDKKCLKGNDFQFNATSAVPGNAPMTHRWYYGDNDSLINNTFAQHTYQNFGPYTVTLISSTNVGNCRDTIEKTMTVFPMPVSSFTIDNDKQCLLNNVFNFTSTSTVPTGTIDFTNWTFGDNTTSSIATPTKSYTKVDSFRVTLNTVTDNGCTDSSFKKVYIFPMPITDFSIGPKTNSCLLNNVFKITNKSKITNGFISTYQFYYGDGDSSLLQNPPDHSYTLSGDYIMFLRTTTDKGCWDTISKKVSVNPNPVLDFDVSEECLGDSTSFNNLSTIAGGGSITEWKWLFGNGKSSSLESPKHKYKTVGSYDVTLTAKTNLGCVDTLIKPGEAVVNPNPKAIFFYEKLRSWENEVDIQYIDSSKDAASWKWDFGPMGTSTDQNPIVYYVDTLTQLTTLIVTNIHFCSDTTSQVLFISPNVVYYMPNAFTPNEDNINETFKPKGLAYALDYKFIIFNRWGEILFKTDNPQLGWDGKYDGALVEQGLYFFRLEFVGADELRHEEKGQVLILR
jgi:gliding motility-associated-like protein